MTDPTATARTLDAIARPSGALAMVAMDQRESLRHMFDLAGAGRPADDVLVRFKLDVADTLGPLASGFLIDRHYGFAAVRDALPASTGLILAADALEQADGGPVEETALDEAVLTQTDLSGVAALKLLVIWRRDAKREARVRLVERFIAECRARGVLSVLEPVVRWGLPFYVRDGKDVCYIKTGADFLAFGFGEDVNPAYREGASMHPIVWNITALDPETEATLRELLRKAVG